MGEGLSIRLGDNVAKLQDILDGIGAPIDVLYPCEQDIPADISGWAISGDATARVMDSVESVVGGNSLKVTLTNNVTGSITHSAGVDLSRFSEGAIAFFLKTVRADDIQSGLIDIEITDGTTILKYKAIVSEIKDNDWGVVIVNLASPYSGTYIDMDFSAVTSFKITIDTSGGLAPFDVYIDFIAVAGNLAVSAALKSILGIGSIEDVIEELQSLVSSVKPVVLWPMNYDVAGDIGDWYHMTSLIYDVGIDNDRSMFGNTSMRADMGSGSNESGYMAGVPASLPLDIDEYKNGRLCMFMKITKELNNFSLMIYDSVNYVEYDLIDKVPISSSSSVSEYNNDFDDGWRTVIIDLNKPSLGSSSLMDWTKIEEIGIYVKSKMGIEPAGRLNIDYMFVTNDNRIKDYLSDILRKRIEGTRLEVYERFQDLYQRNRNVQLLPCESDNARDIGDITVTDDATISLEEGGGFIGLNSLRVKLVNAVGVGTVTKYISFSTWDFEAFENGQLIFFMKVSDWAQLPARYPKLRLIDINGDYREYDIAIDPSVMTVSNDAWLPIVISIPSFDSATPGFEMKDLKNLQLLFDTSNITDPQIYVYVDYMFMRDKASPEIAIVANIQDRLWDSVNDRAMLDSLKRILLGTDSGLLGQNIRQVSGIDQTARDWTLKFDMLDNLDEAISDLRKLLDGTTPGLLGNNLRRVNGTIQTTRDWTLSFDKLANLDIALSALRDLLDGSTTPGALYNGTYSVVDILDTVFTNAYKTLDFRMKDNIGDLIKRSNPQPTLEHSDYVRYIAEGIIDDSNVSDGFIGVEFNTDGGPPQYGESVDAKGVSAFSNSAIFGTLRDYYNVEEIRIRQTGGTPRGADIELRDWMLYSSGFKAYDLFTEVAGVFAQDWSYHPTRPMTFYKRFKLYIKNNSIIAGQNINFEVELIFKNKS